MGYESEEERPKSKAVEARPKHATGSAEAASDESEQEIDDELEIAVQGFHWYAQKVGKELDLLHTQIDSAKDDPPWNERVADHMIGTALELGAMASGSVLAKGVVKYLIAEGTAVSEDGIVKDALKDLFKGGIGAGVAKGRSVLKEKSGSQTSGRFIAIQKDAIDAAVSEDQKHFIRDTRHRVKTVEEAKAISDTCSRDVMYAAATAQTSIVRDLWVAYVAQSRLGTLEGDTRTDLSNQYERDRRAATEGKLFPVQAPSLGTSMHGQLPGVLAVQADAFPFDEQGRSSGAPEIDMAYLGGVSDEIRAQYSNNTLENARIPRHLHVRVVNGYRHGTPNFDVNIDEAGHPQGLRQVETKWLRQKYRSAHSGATADQSTEVREGLSALLRELRVGNIERPPGG